MLEPRSCATRSKLLAITLPAPRTGCRQPWVVSMAHADGPIEQKQKESRTPMLPGRRRWMNECAPRLGPGGGGGRVMPDRSPACRTEYHNGARGARSLSAANVRADAVIMKSKRRLARRAGRQHLWLPSLATTALRCIARHDTHPHHSKARRTRSCRVARSQCPEQESGVGNKPGASHGVGASLSRRAPQICAAEACHGHWAAGLGHSPASTSWVPKSCYAPALPGNPPPSQHLCLVSRFLFLPLCALPFPGKSSLRQVRATATIPESFVKCYRDLRWPCLPSCTELMSRQPISNIVCTTQYELLRPTQHRRSTREVFRSVAKSDVSITNLRRTFGHSAAVSNEIRKCRRRWKETRIPTWPTSCPCNGDAAQMPGRVCSDTCRTSCPHSSDNGFCELNTPPLQVLARSKCPPRKAFVHSGGN